MKSYKFRQPGQDHTERILDFIDGDLPKVGLMIVVVLVLVMIGGAFNG